MKILFQGDSVTDAGRDKTNPKQLGNGYPRYAAELITEQNPGKSFEFYNLGISGDKAESLKARWAEDCMAYTPDILSVLIGVNDTWHYADSGAWMPDEYFKDCYGYILSEAKNAGAKIIMLEQFLLPVPEHTRLRVDVDRKIAVTRSLACEFADVFVPLDGLFAAACVKRPPEFWAADGIHPTEAGARLIAGYYADAVKEILSR